MAKAIKHEFDEGKWQSNFDDYAHGEGQGKSRNAIYKHFKKTNIDIEETETVSEKTEFKKSDWMNDEVGGKVRAKTIPKPISELAEGKMKEVNIESQRKIVRTMYIGLDRLITHWGRGVMNDNLWTIERSPEDLDALENSTVNMLMYYDISIPVSPPMIWGVTLGHAYVPPMKHVMSNRDPLVKRRSIFKRIFSRKKGKTIVKEVENNESN
jgi:hypothetical protein